MESDDDEKRRVMTPPDSWSGKSSAENTGDDSLLSDDSWLSEDDVTTAPETPTTDPEEQLTEVAAHSPADHASDNEVEASPDDSETFNGADDWLAAPTDAALEEPALSAAPPLETEMPVDSEPPAMAPTSDPDAATETADTATGPSSLGAEAVTATVSAEAAKLADKELTDEARSTEAEALLTDHGAAKTASTERKVPAWALAALGLALLLIVGGGWGAFSEREKLQQQILELKNQVRATEAKNQGDLGADDEQRLIADNQSLRLQLATMREQYAGISKEVEEMRQLIAQAQASETAAAGTEASVNETTVEDSDATPSAEPSVATAKRPPVSAEGQWFVNVASYSRRDIAEEWADNIGSQVDRVELQQTEVNGKPLYRVRATGYADKADASAVARSLEQTYKIGPLWVGKDSRDDAASETPQPTPAAKIDPPTTTSDAPLTALSDDASEGGWFIFIDTYSNGVDADAQARNLREAGYEAKVAVESRQGELFYRVQVVGIESEQAGEQTLKSLAQMGDMPNLQLRRY